VIADLKPYPEYQPSGSPWLGDIPAHWQVRPAFGVYQPIHERNTGMQEKTVLSLSYGRIVVKPIEKLRGLVPESFETYQIVNPGDVVVRTTDLQNDHTSKRIGFVRDRGIITSAYLALRTAQDVMPEYGYHLLDVWDGTKAIYGYGSGLRQNLDFSHFKRMPVVVPPPDEQAAIARFLDWANGRLERTIRAKRKVIALLNEQRQAATQRAVTCGLDTWAPKKPTGIPWFGEVPRHWEVRQLGRLVSVQTGFPFSSSGFKQRSGTRLLRGINITPSGIRWASMVSWERVPADGLDAFVLHPGDIVLGMDRPIVRAGVRVATIGQEDVPSLLLQRVARLQTRPQLDANFLLLLLRSGLFRDYIAPIFTGISVPHLSPEQIRRFIVPLPSLREQQSIVEKVRAETCELEALQLRLETEIDLLVEYRIRLAGDIATGRIDVREAAARLSNDERSDAFAAAASEGIDSEEADEEEALP
jgi:type I restriction enzyme S subunit